MCCEITSSASAVKMYENIMKVCRLCSSTDNLKCVFDVENPNMQKIILDTIGVEILPQDISKKICQKCRTVVIKMNAFRLRALKYDRQFKESCKEFLRTGNIKIPNSCVTIKTEESKQKEIKLDNNLLQKSLIITKQHTMKNPIHPSVNDIFKKYPEIKLPNTCLKLDISPCVSMKMNEVENYFRSKNLDMRKYISLAMRSMRTQKSHISKNGDKVPEQKTETKNIDKNSDIKSKETIKPINIKMSPNKSSYSIVEKMNHLKKKDNDQTQKNKEPNKINNISVVGGLEKTDSTLFLHPRKRKLSDNDYVENNNKSVFVESLGLEPSNKPKTNNDSIELAIEKQVHICNTCNSVQYSIKDLKKHQQKHLHCQFCKAKFKNIIQKNEHIEKLCSIKKMMDLPNVCLEKVENNLEVRKKYPSAFIEFPLIPGLEPQLKVDKTPKSLLPENSLEVIDISDDDETVSEKNTSFSKISVPVPKDNSPPCAPQLQNNNHSSMSSSVVKPDIKIKNNQILYTLDSGKTDIQILKELLQNQKPKTTNEKLVQTDLPDNSSIIINQKDFTTDLKNLKSQLYAYKILVEIKKGPFNVSYNYNKGPKKNRKLCLWNDLNPVDIKIPIPRKHPLLPKNPAPSSPAASISVPLDQMVPVPSSVACASPINTSMIPNNNARNTTTVIPTSELPAVGTHISNITVNKNMQLTSTPNITVVVSTAQNHNDSVTVTNNINHFQNAIHSKLPSMITKPTAPSLVNLALKPAIPSSTNTVVYPGNSIIPYNLTTTLSNATGTDSYNPSLSSATAAVPSVLLPVQTTTLSSTTNSLSYITTLSSVTTAGPSIVISGPPNIAVSRPIVSGDNNNNKSNVYNNLNSINESVANIYNTSVLNSFSNSALTTPITVQQTALIQSIPQTAVVSSVSQAAVVQSVLQKTVVQSVHQTGVVQSVPHPVVLQSAPQTAVGQSASQATIPNRTTTVAAPVSDSCLQGTIRVKNVWELK